MNNLIYIKNRINFENIYESYVTKINLTKQHEIIDCANDYKELMRSKCYEDRSSQNT